MSVPFTTLRMMIRGVSKTGRSAPHRLRGNNKLSFGHQLQEAEAPGASAEDSEISQGDCFAYSVERARATPLGRAMLQSRSKRTSRSCISTSSVEAGYAYCFVSSALCPTIHRQPPCGFCSFGKSTSSFLAAASASTSIAARSTARRGSIRSTSEGLQRTLRSSHSQQHCARVEAHLLTYPTFDSSLFYSVLFSVKQKTLIVFM